MPTKPPPPPGTKHFTAFRTAAEEAAMKDGERDNEGGHMSSTAGRIVRTAAADLPYKVILSHHGGAETERGFATMREAEAFVRRNTPVPAERPTLYDRAAEQDLSPPPVTEVSP